jgi:hypothetical protein
MAGQHGEVLPSLLWIKRRQGGRQQGARQSWRRNTIFAGPDALDVEVFSIEVITNKSIKPTTIRHRIFSILSSSNAERASSERQ